MVEPKIAEGAARVWFAYDLGQQIDLERAQRVFAAAAEREKIRHHRRAPDYLQFHPAPLRVDEEAPAMPVGAFATDGRVECTLYDFGAASIAYRIPLAGRTLAELPALASAIEECDALALDSRQRAEALIEKLGDAVRKAGVADLVEDYTVFHVKRWVTPADPEALVTANRALVARILRAEKDPMREAEVEDALRARIAYGLADDLVIDWNGAFLCDPLGEDALAVLEFANVELLEMRFLDDRLDEALDRSHEAVRVRSGRLAWIRPRESRETMRRIATMQIESALLFESVNNAIKMLGDHFLARVYRLAAGRLHLEDWDASILRKLSALESIYEKLRDEAATRRMEILEWIIILLFVVSILVPFVVGGGH